MALHRFSHHRPAAPGAPLSVVRGRATGRERSRGAVIVEFALIAPLLFMLLFGMLTGGLVMERRLAVSAASREGARYGATLTTEQCTPVSNCGGRTWAQQVRNVALTRAGRGVGAADICVALVDGAGSSPNALSPTHTTAGGSRSCYADNSADQGARVQVSIKASQEIQAVVLTIPVTTDARSVARYEQ